MIKKSLSSISMTLMTPKPTLKKYKVLSKQSTQSSLCRALIIASLMTKEIAPLESSTLITSD
jgi:hypothetical protein